MGKAYWALLVAVMVAMMVFCEIFNPSGSWDEPLPTPAVWWMDDTPRPAFWQKGAR